MHLLINNNWQSGYLDYAKYYEKQARIQVLSWYLLGKVEGQYISYPRDWRIIWNYFCSVGLRGLLLKLKSRLLEKGRNEKYYSIGIGKISEESTNFKVGETVLFFAYNHPKCASSLVLDEDFIIKQDAVETSEKQIQFFDLSKNTDSKDLSKYGGWSEFSGEGLDSEQLHQELLKQLEQIKKESFKPNKKLTIKDTKVQQQIDFGAKRQDSDILKGVIFGLGNYAKVNIIPNLNKKIEITGVHEIDPVQLGSKKWGSEYVSTSPQPIADYNADIFFAAGYHHTHADLCVSALKNNRYAVVEKPIATTHNQLKKIANTLEKQEKSKFFACFHKRYNIMNEWARQDFADEPGEAIDYFCIVFEIPLPPKHWYNWSNSKSRIVSNGCHWIDHFLYMNNYSKVTFYSIREGVKGEIFVNMELENQATFSMTLTDFGSNRLGVRDYIELRKGKTSIYMTDGETYRSENARQWLRNKKINKLASYRNMYSTIASKIVNKEPGDSLASLSSSKATLILEEMLTEAREHKKKIVSRTI